MTLRHELVASAATSYNNIGSMYWSKGEHDKVIESFEKALAITLATLGDSHPSTAGTYNNIGSAHRSKGEYDKAAEYQEKALVIFAAALVDSHPSTVVTKNNLREATARATRGHTSGAQEDGVGSDGGGGGLYPSWEGPCTSSVGKHRHKHTQTHTCSQTTHKSARTSHSATCV